MKITPIELLEYSKDNICKAKRKAELPEVYNNKLSKACALLSEIQEYLFNN